MPDSPKIAFIDTFSGASGDMVVGAMIDAGLNIETLRSELSRLNLQGYEISAEKVTRCSISATKFNVEAGHQHHHRTLGDIKKIINDSSLSAGVKETALKIFGRLAVAEAAVHSGKVDEVHFHEVGAVDSIIDIVGAAIGIEQLGIGQIFSGPIRFGSGTVNTQHGVLPLPAPATLKLSEGFPCEYTGVKGELTTPTGAAILTALASFETPPKMKAEAVGMGAGTFEFEGRPNILRLTVATVEAEKSAAKEQVLVLEANIDDMTGEAFGYAMEALFSGGALDVFYTPVQMKKLRPAVLLTVLCKPEDKSKMEEIIFRETTTFGIRSRLDARTILNRTFSSVEVFGEKVRIKTGSVGGRQITASPEYEDCAKIARQRGIAFREVYTAAMKAFNA